MRHMTTTAALALAAPLALSALACFGDPLGVLPRESASLSVEYDGPQEWRDRPLAAGTTAELVFYKKNKGSSQVDLVEVVSSDPTIVEVVDVFDGAATVRAHKQGEVTLQVVGKNFDSEYEGEVTLSVEQARSLLITPRCGVGEREDLFLTGQTVSYGVARIGDSGALAGSGNLDFTIEGDTDAQVLASPAGEVLLRTGTRRGAGTLSSAALPGASRALRFVQPEDISGLRLYDADGGLISGSTYSSTVQVLAEAQGAAICHASFALQAVSADTARCVVTSVQQAAPPQRASVYTARAAGDEGGACTVELAVLRPDGTASVRRAVEIDRY